MKRKEYIEEVIRLYINAPETPQKARSRDWAIASTLFNKKVPIETVAHAFRFAALRRLLRDHQELGPLEKIHSLAYYRTVIEQLRPAELDPGYVEYVERKYRRYFAPHPKRK